MPTIAEELLLLAHDEDGGLPLAETSSLNSALVAATISELVEDGILSIEREPTSSDTERTVLRRSGATPEGDLFVEVAAIADGKSVKSALTILGVHSFRGSGGRMKDVLIRDLIDDGVLSRESRKALGFIPYNAFPAPDPVAQAGIVDRLRAVLIDGDEPDPRTAALIAMSSPLGLVRKHFPDPSAKIAEDRAAEISRADWAGAALRDAIVELQAVLFALVLAPSIIRKEGD